VMNNPDRPPLRFTPMKLFLSSALALLVAFLLSGCGAPPPDEEQIRARIDGMVEALAERNGRRVLAPLAEDFTAETWDMDRRGMRLLLEREMRAHQRLAARVYDLSVEIHEGSRASAEFQVILTGGSGLIPQRGRWYKVRTGWRLDGSDWMLISASWEDVIGR
jgi:hypothetical protein